MNEKMVVREWYDEDNDMTYCIRFVKINDMWYAVLKDICFALGLTAKYVAQRIDVEFILKRVVPSEDRSFETTSPISGQHRNGYKMLLVNENGIYQCIVSVACGGYLADRLGGGHRRAHVHRFHQSLGTQFRRSCCVFCSQKTGYLGHRRIFLVYLREDT